MRRSSTLLALAMGTSLAASVSAQATLRIELESGDPERIAAARERVLALPEPQQVDFFRDAIWSKAPQAAVWSANRLKHDQVDLREAARVIDLLMPELKKRAVLGEEELDFDEFRQLLGSSEVPRLLQSFPETGEWPTPGAIISESHRQVRVAHIPALCRLVMDPNPRVAQPALDYLMGAFAPRTNQHREDIGLALLHRIHVTVPATGRSAKREGYPLLLARCLEHFDRCTALGKETFATQAWIWRWAGDEKAGAGDRDILLKLLESDNEQALSIAVRGLANLVDEVSQKKLGGRHDTLEDTRLQRSILWALAHRGGLLRRIPDLDKNLRARVRRQASVADHNLWLGSESDPLALGLYWQLHPTKGGERFRELLFHADAERRNVALELCTGNPCEYALAGLQVRPKWFESLGTDLPDTELPGRFLAKVVVHVPGMRRLDLAKKAVAQADLKKPEKPQHDMEDFLAFLEVVAPRHLQSLLATWAAADDADVRKHAHKLQLKIGDLTAVNELVTVLDKNELGERAPLWLARIRSPKVEAFLRRRAGSEDPKIAPRYLHALAVHYGLPESVGFSHALPRPGDPVFEKARKLVLSRKPIDALVCVLESLEDKERRVKDLGLVADPRVTRYLEQTRKRRHLGLYAWATSQLALQGDNEARKEFWQGCLLGRYRWIDNSNPRALTFNFDLETIPFWLSELETNCCRRNSANQIFRHLFGLDLYENNRLFPEVTQAREFWERYRNNLRWSRIKGHYVPGPDR